MVLALTARSIKLSERSNTSSSNVSIRLRVSGPVSVILPLAYDSITPRGPFVL